MKKALSALSILILVLALTACGKNKEKMAASSDEVVIVKPTNPPTPTIPEIVQKETVPPTESTIPETEPETEPIEMEENVPETIPETTPEETIDPNIELPVESERDYPDDGEVIYTNNWVNVRSGPSLESQIIGKLEEGTELFRYEVTKNNWSKILYEGKIAYIFNQYVDTQKTEKFKLYQEVDETVFAGHDVNIRARAEYDAPILGKLLQGKSIRRIGIGQNGWSQVMYNNTLAYINSEYLSLDPFYVIPMEKFLQATTPTESKDETKPTEETKDTTESTVVPSPEPTESTQPTTK